MERFTRRTAGMVSYDTSIPTQSILGRLADYEDTGLAPDDVVALKKERDAAHECTIKPDLCVLKIEDGKIVNILGTPYKIVVKAYEQDPDFERNGSGAYCDNDALLLVLCDMNTYPGWENGDYEDSAHHQMKLLLRHEIVHAFLFQSGLSSNSGLAEEWATNEEMVDWIALQGPKIYKAWEEAGAL